MSTPRRLYMTDDLMQALDILDQAAQDYKKNHLIDYEKYLLDPLQDLNDDPRLDYVEDFANDYGLMRFMKDEIDSMPERLDYQIDFSGNLQELLKRLLEKIQIFQKAYATKEGAAKACASAIAELNKLAADAEQLLLLGYRNMIAELVSVLKNLEESIEQYKQKHSADHLYDEALEQPFKQICSELLKEAFDEEKELEEKNEAAARQQKIYLKALEQLLSQLISDSQKSFTFVQGFLDHCGKIRNAKQELEEKISTPEAQKACMQELRSRLKLILTEVTLFKKAPEIGEREEKACNKALEELSELEYLGGKLRL
ncbi:MAG TPA: hypothetical protein VHA13_02375 [Gammaproteobacteria bacterium]|nr:hypothetical protein [Gammaproteobacteria bacterium]